MTEFSGLTGNETQQTLDNHRFILRLEKQIAISQHAIQGQNRELFWYRVAIIFITVFVVMIALGDYFRHYEVIDMINVLHKDVYDRIRDLRRG